ncbi:MAG: glycosyltransferase family 4 protein [Bacteroidota bacterium]
MAQKLHNKKVGFFISSDSWINYQQWPHEVSKALFGRGYPVYVISSKGGKLISKSKRYGIPVCPYKKRMFLLSSVLQLSGIFRRECISTLFINHPKDLKKASIAAWLAGVDKVIYRRGTISPVKDHIINKWIFRRLINDVITNSDANRDVMVRKKPSLFHRDKVNVIYNGLDISRFDEKQLTTHHFRKNGELLIGLLTGHFNNKRFLQLIQMIRRERETAPQYKFLIYGSGNEKAELSKKLKALGVKGELVYWDSRSKSLLEFMNSIDIFMSGFTKQRFNYPVLYAMALNRPVIAYNKGSSPEMIRDKTNGFLLDYGDLQGAVRRLEALTDNKLREKLGEEARNTVKLRFDFEQSIDKIEELIDL